MKKSRVAIVGGGLAGLVASIHLASKGVACVLVEKRTYPFHRVCGEYISNEVIPYLTSLQAFPKQISPARLTQFQLTSTNGKSAQLSLDLGGFGVSRFELDHSLYLIAKKLGVECILETEVTDIVFENDQFSIHTNHGLLNADIAIGSFGKRSKLDKQLARAFVHRHSPYVGVKYHIRLPRFPNNLIALHNFHQGYCGISRVENNIINLCYLTHRDHVKAHGSLSTMESAILFQNPFLREIFREAEFIFEKPETINEISFETKSPLEGHILMAGDAAGMIAPLCGNGMAMAIHSAKMVSEHILRFRNENSRSRDQLEQGYARAWNNQFATRLRIGRQIQRLFGNEWTSNLAVNLANRVRPVANYLMKKTHGDSF